MRPAVLNGSLGGGKSQAVNRATTALSTAGILSVVAAGNDSRNACDVSPASADGALTVAASTEDDEQASFSNRGECVELYAPGQDILSARIGGGSVTMSGTSMAAPHATGLAALYKQAHPDAASADVAAWIDEVSTRDVLTNVSPGTPTTSSSPTACRPPEPRPDRPGPETPVPGRRRAEDCPALPGGCATTTTAPRRVVGTSRPIRCADAPPPCGAPRPTPRTDHHASRTALNVIP